MGRVAATSAPTTALAAFGWPGGEHSCRLRMGARTRARCGCWLESDPCTSPTHGLEADSRFEFPLRLKPTLVPCCIADCQGRITFCYCVGPGGRRRAPRPPLLAPAPAPPTSTSTTGRACSPTRGAHGRRPPVPTRELACRDGGRWLPAPTRGHAGGRRGRRRRCARQ